MSEVKLIELDAISCWVKLGSFPSVFTVSIEFSWYNIGVGRFCRGTKRLALDFKGHGVFQANSKQDSFIYP